MRNEDFVGKKYGKLTVLEFLGEFSTGGRKASRFKCVCECGTEVIRKRSVFVSSIGGLSCGCASKNRTKTDTFGGKKNKSPIMNIEVEPPKELDKKDIELLEKVDKDEAINHLVDKYCMSLYEADNIYMDWRKGYCSPFLYSLEKRGISI